MGGKKKLVKMRHYPQCSAILGCSDSWFLGGENDSSCFSYYPNGDKSVTASTQYNNAL